MYTVLMYAYVEHHPTTTPHISPEVKTHVLGDKYRTTHWWPQKHSHATFNGQLLLNAH